MNKRDFVRRVGGASLSLLLSDKLFERYTLTPPRELAATEDFWDSVRKQFILTPDYINLENGYYCLQAQPVLEAFIRHVREINVQASRYLRTRQYDDKAAVRDRLAQAAGCDPKELIITRNTTESLDTVIAGFDWKPGDEAVMAEQDYGAMLDMFTLQARRYGMVKKVVSLPMDPASDEEIVRLYESAITPKTRLLMICHMVNITGQILPVARVAEMAHRHGVQVMVDGAHTFAHLDYKVPDLGGDYWGTSLHKWLGSPIGAGLLWVRKDHIAPLWPIFSDQSKADDDIAKLNHTGTHPVHTDLAINDALDYHLAIGIARKEARLRYLQHYWTGQVRGKRRMIVNTPADPARSCAIANVGIEGVAPADLMARLFDKYRVWTVAIDGAGVHGVRVTPHLFTSTADLDALVRALHEIAA